jgi:hypothetical protein
MENGSQFGAYTILRTLGAGGGGNVYQARHNTLDRVVALKVLWANLPSEDRPELRFQREFEAASQLVHPNLARVYDFGKVGDTMFLAMEYIPGQTLASLIDAGPIPTANAIQWTRELLDAVGACHAGRVIHRDIKPANIMIDEAGHARLLDMGLAKSMERTAITADVQIAGTPRYIPPEMINGDTSDERSDLYQIGLVLYECLTGQPAFEAKTMTELLVLICNKMPVMPPVAEPAHEPLQTFLQRTLVKDPGSRISTAKEGLEILDQVVAITRRVRRQSGSGKERVALRTPTGGLISTSRSGAGRRRARRTLALGMGVFALGALAGLALHATRTPATIPLLPGAGGPSELECAQVVKFIHDCEKYVDRATQATELILSESLRYSNRWKALEADGNTLTAQLKTKNARWSRLYPDMETASRPGFALLARLTTWEFTMWTLMSRVKSTRLSLERQVSATPPGPAETFMGLSSNLLGNNFTAAELPMLLEHFRLSGAVLAANMTIDAAADTILAGELDDSFVLTASLAFSPPAPRIVRQVQNELSRYLARLRAFPGPRGPLIYQLLKALWIQRLPENGKRGTSRELQADVDRALENIKLAAPNIRKQLHQFRPVIPRASGAG